MQQSPIDKRITEFIFYRPEVVAKLLKNGGYKLSRKVTLDELIEKTFKVLYEKGDKSFANALDKAIATDGHSQFVTLAVTAGLSIASTLIGSFQAKKNRALQKDISVAKLEADKLLADEQLKAYKDIERTKILANTLEAYASNAQSEATKREKNVFVYLIATGLGISILYGTVILMR